MRNMRMGMRDLNKEYDKTEDDLKALQSVGQIIGELLRQLDDERYIVKASSGPRYVVGCRNKVRQRGTQCKGAGYMERVGGAESDGARIGPRLPRRGEQCERTATASPRNRVLSGPCIQEAAVRGGAVGSFLAWQVSVRGARNLASVPSADVHPQYQCVGSGIWGLGQ